MIDPRFLDKEQFKEWKKNIDLLVMQTFNRKTRSYNLQALPYKERCLNCAQSFLYVKNKRKQRYCTNECRDGFTFPLWNDLRIEIWEKEKGKCQICKKQMSFITRADIDHIQELLTFETPIEQFKSYFDRKNLQLLCKPCHKRKTALFLKEKFSKPKIHSENTKPITDFF